MRIIEQTLSSVIFFTAHRHIFPFVNSAQTKYAIGSTRIPYTGLEKTLRKKEREKKKMKNGYRKFSYRVILLYTHTHTQIKPRWKTIKVN